MSPARTFGHSRLLPLLLLILWWAGPVRMRRATLTLGLASLLHLVLDGVLSTAQTLLWPLLGWEFERSQRVR